eukprot:4230555-Alexandrium_andersonii.AAC.1
MVLANAEGVCAPGGAFGQRPTGLRVFSNRHRANVIRRGVFGRTGRTAWCRCWPPGRAHSASVQHAAKGAVRAGRLAQTA